jgi:hypothetical protein
MPFTDPTRQKEYYDNYYLANRDRILERDHNHRLNNKNMIRERELRKTFRKLGVAESEINKALAAWECFDGVCQACGQVCSNRFDTDHDHIALTFRGIVGSKCNVALGMVKDNPKTLRLLATYLERPQ